MHNGRNCAIHLPQVVAVMLQLHIRRLQDPTESGIVLVLGCSDWQSEMLHDELTRLVPELAHGIASSAGSPGQGAARAGRSDSDRAGAGGGSLAASLASAAAAVSAADDRAAAGDLAAAAAAAGGAAAAAAVRDTGSTVAPEDAAAAGGTAPPASQGRMRGGIAPALPVQISNEISAQERAELYRTRWVGLICISPAVLQEPFESCRCTLPFSFGHGVVVPIGRMNLKHMQSGLR